MFDITIVVSLLLSLSLSRRRAVWGHSCHILPFQQIVWNSHFPSELVRTAKTAPNLFQIGVGYGNHAAPGRGNQRCSHHCSANQHREKSTERLGVTVAVFGMKTTLSMSGGSWTIWAILCEVCVCVCVCMWRQEVCLFVSEGRRKRIRALLCVNAVEVTPSKKGYRASIYSVPWYAFAQQIALQSYNQTTATAMDYARR